MPQRDCGCPGLVTPTLDELLAVARSKPLPRVRVRERRAPPARVGASLKGWLSWSLINRQGEEVRAGEGPNLILDQGLDQIATIALIPEQQDGPSPATFFPLIRYAAVGTSSSAPTASDTGLGSELARTDATFATETLTRPSPGVYRLTRFIEFDYDEANGVLAEWGFSSSGSVGSNLFNRALFTDSGGSPDAITKTDQEKLRLTYTLEISLSPVTFTAGSFTVTNVGVVNGDYTLIGATAPSGAVSEFNMRCAAPDLKLFSAWARGTVGVVHSGILSFPPLAGAAYAHASDLSGVTYSSVVSKINDTVNPVAPRVAAAPRDAYVTGSFQRTGGAWKWDTAYANLDPIRGFYVQGAYERFNSGNDSCGLAGYAFDLDTADEFSKDNEHVLTVGVPTVSWGRAT